MSHDTVQARQARAAKQRLENRRLGLLLFQYSWMFAFLSLVIVNWQLRFSYTSWPPPNVAAMGVGLPSLATIGLLASVVLARRARRVIENDDVDAFWQLWCWVILLGLGFVIIMASEWVRVGVVDTEDTQYQSVFRLMTGFHMVHAIAVGWYMLQILHNMWQTRRVDAGLAKDHGTLVRYHSQHAWPIEVATKLWDFVFVAWLIYYVVLYWWRS